MRPFKRNIRVGLQVKAVLILTFMVLSATLAGGWIYYGHVCNWLQTNELQQAERFAEALSLSAGEAVAKGNRRALQQLGQDFLTNASVLYVAFVGPDGRELASVSKGFRGRAAQPVLPEAITVSYARPTPDNSLIVVRPIHAPGDDAGQRQVVGAVRMTFDTERMAGYLKRAHSTMLLLSCLMVIGALPVGNLLVWRVLSLPVRRLMQVTRKLAEGDFTARAAAARNDEIGSLAESFNTMAAQIDAQHQQLLAANEQLEQKVELRTAELNRANERLRAEMAEKEDFLRAVSHDLNAPLRNIAGMTTMVMMKWRDQLPEEAVARLQRVLANVEAETELITELLELSRIKTRPQRRELTDMGDLIRQIGASFEYDLKAKGIRLDVADDLPTLYVERNRMRQVFQNLIDNAVKYIGDRPDPRIEVRYRRDGDEHVFGVADNGPGIAPDDCQKIFYVFRRAANAATSKVPGKGVGLASVKSIVSNYDGRVWVDSDLGKGSTFFVTLSARCTDPSPEDVPHDNDQDAAADRAGHHLVGR